MIDTNTRYLKFEDGYYSNGGGRLPCDNCALQDICPDRDKKCPMMIPTLGFNDTKGTHTLFNTLRVGKSWSQRIVPGQTISIYDVGNDRHVGFAEVVQIYCGNFNDMMKTHAHANHLMLGKDFDAAKVEMSNWFKKQYGPSIIEKTSKITAIYLLRRDWDIAEAFLEKVEEARYFIHSERCHWSDTRK